MFGTIKNIVHFKGGNWFSFVKGYDWNESLNGYTGNRKPIDLIQIINGYNNSPKYRISPLNNNYYGCKLCNKVGSGPVGYAGTLGKEIDRIQIIPY